VYCSWRRFSAFDNGHEHFAGSIGLGTSTAVTKGLSEADLVLSFGFGVEQVTCDTARLGRPGAHIIQFAPAADPRAARYLSGGQAEYVVVDPARAAQVLAQAAKGTRASVPARPGTSKARRSAGTRQAAPAQGAVRMEHVMSCLDSRVPGNAIVISDAGNFAQWMLRHIPFDQDRIFLGALNGAMGYSLPAGLGAGTAVPDRPCWVLAGDGGFAMLEAEMETASRLGLSVVACVFDNGLYGTIRARQEEVFPGRAFGTSTGHVDFAAAARAHGWQGWTVDKDIDIEQVLGDVLAASGCRLVHFIVEPFPLEA
jgi:acetolactate synthase I/II/III large subunit